MEHFLLFAALWNSGETLYTKRLCQKKQCFSQLFTAYSEWNPRKTHAVPVLLVGQPCLLPLQRFVQRWRIVCQGRGMAPVWSVPHYTLLSPGSQFLVPVDTIQLLLVVLPEVTKPAGMSYHWEREDSPESIHPAEGTWGLLFWCFLGETLQAIAKLLFCEQWHFVVRFSKPDGCI